MKKNKLLIILIAAIVIVLLMLLLSTSCTGQTGIPKEVTKNEKDLPISDKDSANTTETLTTESAVSGPGALTSEFKADGTITDGEYTGKQTYGDFEINWANDEEYLYTAIKAKTQGFAAVAIQPGTRMKNADIIIGYVKDGSASVFDSFSTGDFGPHPPDIDLGGTDDVIEFGGSEDGTYTIIEFKRLLTTGDKYDNDIVEGKNQVIWAYGNADDAQIKHSTRGYGEIEISLP